MENSGNGVRKGAWTKEEDILLKDCIHKFGEGKWHLVPLRAGLKRCRKSCRLRWLNYLRPNLNRGFFSKDEVDLIVRLHKLLGNRWSLIAGRLPGRTANDIKNFWNTHISKKPASTARENHRGKTITGSNIVRPTPRTFSNSQPPSWSSILTGSSRLSSSPKLPPSTNFGCIDLVKSHKPSSSNGRSVSVEPCLMLSLQEDIDECLRWWEDLLEKTENEEQAPLLFSGDAPPVAVEGFTDQEEPHGNLMFDDEMPFCII